jgi:SAM-dependent methyltransferase
MQGRLRWVEADISEPSWHSRLGEEQVDAVVTTTALHWLHAGSLVELYRQLGVLVRPGGVFLNGDGFGFAPHLPSFNTITEHGQAQWAAMARAAEKEDWEAWWDQLRREPGMEPFFAERARRFSTKARPPRTLVEVHLAALRNAGFHEVGVIWQHLDNRVVMAVR